MTAFFPDFCAFLTAWEITSASNRILTQQTTWSHHKRTARHAPRVIKMLSNVIIPKAWLDRRFFLANRQKGSFYAVRRPRKHRETICNVIIPSISPTSPSHVAYLHEGRDAPNGLPQTQRFDSCINAD
jgi:hypothetical protein